MATRFIYRCADCDDTAEIPEGAPTVVTEAPTACRRGHIGSWRVQPVSIRSEVDEKRLEAIREARASAETETTRLRRLVVLAVYAQVPVRDIAAAAGVAPQTPLNWAKADAAPSPTGPEEG